MVAWRIGPNHEHGRFSLAVGIQEGSSACRFWNYAIKFVYSITLTHRRACYASPVTTLMVTPANQRGRQESRSGYGAFPDYPGIHFLEQLD